MGMCKCGGLLEAKPINNYVVPGALLGVQNVTLIDGVLSESCAKCGSGRITIPDLPGLVAAVALTRAKLPFKLNNREIKFLRKALDIPANKMAEYLKVAPETLSRWENEKTPISEQSEMLLRLVVIALLQNKAEGVNPEMEAVAKMKVQVVFEPEELAKCMQFVRVRKIRDKTSETEQLWRDERKKAACLHYSLISGYNAPRQVATPAEEVG